MIIHTCIVMALSFFMCLPSNITGVPRISKNKKSKNTMQKKVTPQDAIQVKLKVVLDKINVPTVIKSAVIPGDTEESLFILTQPGEIWLIREDKPQLILDISAKNGGDVLKLGGVKGADPSYDERGLLGIEFHPEFTQNGRFFLYFSTQDSKSTSPYIKKPDPCDPGSLKIKWENQNDYNHENVVEEWKFTNITTIKRVRRFLSIKHPFFNHVSINNLFWVVELNRLLLLTGDGGFRDAPFNLAQDDAFFHGKVIALDVDADAWKNYMPKPIARFDELSPEIRKLCVVLIKGFRNWSGISEYKKDATTIRFFGQPGQDAVEAIYALTAFSPEVLTVPSKPLNIGWPGWEGSFPALQNLDCSSRKLSKNSGNLKSVTFYQEAVNLAVERKLPYCEYYHQDNRPGKVKAVCISGQQVYQGNLIPELKDHVIIADWAHNIADEIYEGGQTVPDSPGLLICASIDNQLDKLHEYKKIEIAHDFKKPAYFVSLGANKDQTRIFLGTYQTTGSVKPHLGTVFELVSR